MILPLRKASVETDEEKQNRSQERMALSKFGLRATRSIGVPG